MPLNSRFPLSKKLLDDIETQKLEVQKIKTNLEADEEIIDLQKRNSVRIRIWIPALTGRYPYVKEVMLHFVLNEMVALFYKKNNLFY